MLDSKEKREKKEEEKKPGRQMGVYIRVWRMWEKHDDTYMLGPN
jgi:hypothetical protein